jgi:hypothetical protein
MDLGSILIGLALALLTAAFVARPLIERPGMNMTPEHRRLSTLEAERDRVLASLQELDLDYAMGKVLEADYRTARAELVTRGASTLKAIDDLSGGVGEEAAAASPSQDDWEAEIEVAVLRLRGHAEEAAAGFCGQCGQPVVGGDRFCARCGARLSAAEGEA